MEKIYFLHLVVMYTYTLIFRYPNCKQNVKENYFYIVEQMLFYECILCINVILSSPVKALESFFAKNKQAR